MGDAVGTGAGSWAKALELARANINALSKASFDIHARRGR